VAITDQRIYNIHKKKVKRTIDIKDIGGITKTVPPSKSATEFTIGVPSEYDYRFNSDKREEIIEYIKRCFFLIKHKNMPMFHVTKKDLNDFTTTEKDMKKGISKFPTSDYRVSQGEDLFAQSLNLAHTQSVVDTTLQDDGVFAGN